MAYRIGAFAVFASLVLLAAVPAASADTGVVDKVREELPPLDGTCDDPGCLPGSNPGWSQSNSTVDDAREKLPPLDGTCDDPGCLPGSGPGWSQSTALP